MAGYTRQSTYTDGDVITAAHTNDEFDQILAAFNNTTGHAHDGTAAEGPVIGLIGDPGIATPKNKVVVDDTNNQVEISIDVSGTSTEQFVIKDGVIEPTTTNDIDLGSSSKEFKDLYLDGTATIDGLAMPTTTVTDILDEDTMSSDSATALATQQSIKAYVDSQVTAQDLDFQGDSGGALNIDLDSETLTIAGGTGIDTTGSGNTLTVDIDSTVATLTGTQTLTNKTLTTPVIASISNTGTITLPTSTDTLVGRATTDTLTNKTLTSAVLNGTVSGTSIKDEDDMLSDSASHLATQQSIKAYVDTEVAGVTAATGNELENVVEDTTPQLGGDLDTNGNSIVLPDSSGSADRIKLGDTTDTSIYHQGTTTFIKTNTGNTTVIDTASLSVKFGAEFVATFYGNDSVDLYYDNSKKFETTTDGVTVTGKAVADELDVDNITINGNTISSTDTDGDITLDPNGTGNVLLGNFEFDVDQTVGAGQDNYVLTYDNSTGHISLEAAAAGGISDVVSDTTPQLGGDLDVNGNSIVSVSNGNIAVAPDGTGEFQVTGTSTFTGSSTFTGGIYEFDNIRIDGNGISNTTVNPITIEGLAYPNSDGTANQVLTTNGSGTLSFTDVPPDPNAISFAIALG